MADINEHNWEAEGAADAAKETQAQEDLENPHFIIARALPEPWRSHFPKSMKEAQAFEPIVARFSLAMRVLVVANTRQESAWSAYIDAVPGMSHKLEQDAVLLYGTKLPEATARTLFPRFDDIRYAF